MDFEDIEFWSSQFDEQVEGLFWLRLDRPEKKNAFNPQVVDELWEILEKCALNQEIRVMAISSTSDEFTSAGADIKWFYNLSRKEGKEVSQKVQRVFGKLELLPFPVIFAVKGLNLTAGFEVMVASDIIIAAQNAKMGQIEAKWALTPGGGGTQRLTRLVGILKARELIYTAKIIGAQEALSIGLVNHVVPLAELDAKVRELSEQMVERTQNCLKDAKHLINKAYYPQAKGFSEEQKIFGRRFGSGEPRASFSQFINRSKSQGKDK